MLSFKCTSCSKIHEGIPTFGWNYPVHYMQIPEYERESRALLGSDDCVIDEKYFYIRGCLEIPVHGESEPFVWGVWVSLSKDNFMEWVRYFGKERRSHIGPYFAWLSSDIWVYEESPLNLKTTVYIRDDCIRPYIEIQESEHPLYKEQSAGISVERVAELYEMMVHPDKFA